MMYNYIHSILITCLFVFTKFEFFSSVLPFLLLANFEADNGHYTDGATQDHNDSNGNKNII